MFKVADVPLKSRLAEGLIKYEKELLANQFGRIVWLKDKYESIQDESGRMAEI